MRQFGYRQGVPENCNCREPPHGKDFRTGGKGGPQYQHCVTLWNERASSVVGPGVVEVVDSIAYPPMIRMCFGMRAGLYVT